LCQRIVFKDDALPAEAALRADLEGGRFLRGVTQKKWRLISLSWPDALIAISAAERKGSPSEYVFRFDLNGYPTSAPTAGLWDVDKNQLLAGEDRPTGGPNVAIAFRSDWENGRALYLPCDRVALDSHVDWKLKYAMRAWRAGADITHYLGMVHEILNSASYQGTRRTVAQAQ